MLWVHLLQEKTIAKIKGYIETQPENGGLV